MPERFDNLVDLCERSCERYADRPLYGQKRDGAWRWTTYRELHTLVADVRGGLASLGVGPGDRVAIIANNRPEWVAVAYATYGLEAALVPMYQAQQARDWQHILADSRAKVVVVATDEIDRAVALMRGDLPGLRHVIGLHLPATHSRSFATLTEVGEESPAAPRSPPGGAIAGFIYTSGTTGKPKGVLLSHDNITSNVNAVHSMYAFEPDDRSLAFLPWAHSYGQTAEVHTLLSMGCSTAINEDVSHLLEDLAEVKPTILIAVPRIFHRLYAAVRRDLEDRPALLRRIVEAGIRGAMKRAHGEHVGPIERLELAFDEIAVFGKVRERFGGRLKYAISASTTLSPDIARFIDAMGITVYEGYGLSETSPIVSANYPGARRLGSVGKVIPGVRVEIDRGTTEGGPDGEIVVHGPNVMVGYNDLPEETARAFTPDGGFRTGDLGHFDADGFLYVTGRIKEQYKLDNGKYVMPSPLEDELKLSPFVANAMLCGDNQPFNVALVVLDQTAVSKWAREQNVTIDGPMEDHPRVRDSLLREVARHSAAFRGYERPRGLVLTVEDFTTANGLLTPTLKLKRRDVLARHADRIARAHAVPVETAAHAPA